MLLKIKDIFDLSAAPAVNRLVVIADHKQVVLTFRQQSKPSILDGVGVLEFVDMHLQKPTLIEIQQFRIVAQ